MKKFVKIGLFALMLILVFTFFTGCDGGVIPPIITSSYTVYFSSYDGVSGSLYVDGSYEGYLYPYGNISAYLSAGSHSVTFNGSFYGYITVSYSGETFSLDSYGNIY